MRQEITNPNCKSLLSDMVSMIPDIKYFSPGALLQFYTNILDMSLELATGEREKRKGVERAELTRYIGSVQRKRQHVKDGTREILLTQIYESLLQSEGMGILIGFGLTGYDTDEGRRKVKGCNLLDPEKKSIYELPEQLSEPSEERLVFWKGDLTMAKKEKNKSVEKPTKPTTDKGVVTRVQLQETAAELNEIMGLNPEIDLDEADESLKAKIIKAAGLLNEADTISDKTRKVLESLKCAPAPQVAAKKETPVEKMPTKTGPELVKTKPQPPEEAVPPSRASVMAGILNQSTTTPMTKKEMISAMHEQYGGSATEAYFQVTTFLRLVQELGQLEDKDGKLSYAPVQ